MIASSVWSVFWWSSEQLCFFQCIWSSQEIYRNCQLATFKPSCLSIIIIHQRMIMDKGNVQCHSQPINPWGSGKRYFDWLILTFLFLEVIWQFIYMTLNWLKVTQTRWNQRNKHCFEFTEFSILPILKTWWWCLPS